MLRFRLRAVFPMVALALSQWAVPAEAWQQADRVSLREHEVLVNPLELAAHPDVQKELNIDEQTSRKIRELFVKEQEDEGRVLRARKMPRENRRLAFNRIRWNAEAQLYEWLNEAQAARLDQLRLQQDGYVSLARPELAEKLDLDMVQGAMVRQGARELYRQQQKFLIRYRWDGDIDLEDIPSRMAQIRREFDKKLEGVLKPEQREKWKSMLGEPLPVVLEPLKYAKDSLEKIQEHVKKGEALLLDVRDQEDWDEGHLEGAVLLPLRELSSEQTRVRALRKLLLTVPKEQTVYCYSTEGRTALLAAQVIRDYAYDAHALKPGYLELVEAGFAPSK